MRDEMSGSPDVWEPPLVADRGFEPQLQNVASCPAFLFALRHRGHKLVTELLSSYRRPEDHTGPFVGQLSPEWICTTFASFMSPPCRHARACPDDTEAGCVLVTRITVVSTQCRLQSRRPSAAACRCTSALREPGRIQDGGTAAAKGTGRHSAESAAVHR